MRTISRRTFCPSGPISPFLPHRHNVIGCTPFPVALAPRRLGSRFAAWASERHSSCNRLCEGHDEDAAISAPRGGGGHLARAALSPMLCSVAERRSGVTQYGAPGGSPAEPAGDEAHPAKLPPTLPGSVRPAAATRSRTDAGRCSTPAVLPCADCGVAAEFLAYDNFGNGPWADIGADNKRGNVVLKAATDSSVGVPYPGLDASCTENSGPKLPIGFFIPSCKSTVASRPCYDFHFARCPEMGRPGGNLSMIFVARYR